jgi:hypothetical protein
MASAKKPPTMAPRSAPRYLQRVAQRPEGAGGGYLVSGRRERGLARQRREAHISPVGPVSAELEEFVGLCDAALVRLEADGALSELLWEIKRLREETVATIERACAARLASGRFGEARQG